MVKVAPLGGPRRLLAVAAELGVPVTVSSALDSAVGVAAGVAAAAALPGVGAGGGPGGDDDEIPAAGLGTGGFFVEDVVDPGVFVLEDGHLPVRRVAPDPARMENLRIGGERRDWWLDRIRRCHALL
ncbi:O-succinylbenzoate synthase [Dietzia cinnamea P4]|nr:O-succinylbenzoate synthase [Dietzia cinnamea P4]